MPYEINGEPFRTKEDVADRCRRIIETTPDGQIVDAESAKFLFALFQHHHQYNEKSKGGVKHITTGKAEGGTRCFYLVKEGDGKLIDISFHESKKHLPKVPKK